MSLRCGEPRCFDQDESDVCYSAWIANIRVPLRYAPTGSAPVVRDTFLEPGQHFCRQSVNQTAMENDPACTRNLEPRPSQNGYLWGYKNAGGVEGWAFRDAMSPDASYVGEGNGGCCGPATGEGGAVGYRCGEEFRNIVCEGRVECAGDQSCAASSVSGIEGLNGRTFLRYAPQSSAFYYLEQGDSVELLCQCGAYTCVSTRSSEYGIPFGTRGWILSSKIG